MKSKRIKKFFLSFILFFILLFSILWLMSLQKYSTEFGVSFNQDRATSLGLDWKKVYIAILDDMKPKYIRIAAMWSDVEKSRGQWNFENVDWMMAEAKKRGTRVMLVVGQKAPRWPECHVPDWLKGESAEVKMKLMNTYITQVVNRYKDNKVLEIWQVENEPFINFRFGECVAYDRKAVYGEIALVRSLDPAHRIIITDSGELSTWRRAIKAGDLFGTTVYRMVETPRGFPFTYDWLPAAFYRLKAKVWGRDMSSVFVVELQAEPWFTDSTPLDTPLEKQIKRFSLNRLKKNIDYAERIGVPRAYLWGVEWWYWLKEVKGRGEYWAVVKERQTN